MKALVLGVAVLVGGGVASASEIADANRQDPFKTVTVAVAGYGVGAALAGSHVWPAASMVAFATIGPMLEWQSDCAKHGLTNYEGQNTAMGNGGYLNTFGPVSEERVKWQQAPNGWMQRKCAE